MSLRVAELPANDPMISQCANPECGAPFVYLREGQVLALRSNLHSAQVEFYWLCGECSARLRLETTVEGSVHLVPAHERQAHATVSHSHF
jgi:hypothetical protein